MGKASFLRNNVGIIGVCGAAIGFIALTQYTGMSATSVLWSGWLKFETGVLRVFYDLFVSINPYLPWIATALATAIFVVALPRLFHKPAILESTSTPSPSGNPGTEGTVKALEKEVAKTKEAATQATKELSTANKTIAEQKAEIAAIKQKLEV